MPPHNADNAGKNSEDSYRYTDRKNPVN